MVEKGGTLLLRASMALCFIGAVAIFVLPQLLFVRLRENERNAALALQQLAGAEMNYHDQDSDGNGVHDFWTGDVAGLYSREASGWAFLYLFAHADSAPIKTPTSKPVPYYGYYFQALRRDRSLMPDAQNYQTDTDKSGRKVHNLSHFGICAYPARYGLTGHPTLFINEDRTVHRIFNRGVPLTDFPDDRSMIELVAAKSSDPLFLLERVSYFVAGGLLVFGIVLAFWGRPPHEPKP